MMSMLVGGFLVSGVAIWLGSDGCLVCAIDGGSVGIV
jgi:hypothetical protein